MTSIRGIALALGLLTLAGCQGQGATIVEDPAWPGGTFRSATVTEHGRPRPLVAGTQIELRLGDDGQLIARAGCNQIEGTYRRDGGVLVVSDFRTTAMGCDAARTEQDRWLSRLLGSRPHWSQTGGTPATLTLTSGDTVVELVAVQPGPPLVGTRWVVDSLIRGEIAGSTPAGTEAHLEIDEAGRLTGTGGCNSLSGQVTITADEITVDPLITTKMACGGARDQLERAVLDVLNSAAAISYTIADGHLTLTAGSYGLRLTPR